MFSETPLLPPRHSSLLDGISEASSIRLNNRIYELQEAGRDIITLSLGEAFFDIPLPSFEGLPAQKIHHYSHSRGVPLLREKLAAYQQEISTAPVDAAQEILVTAGSKAAIYMALTALLEPGDEVIIPEPLWVSYPDQVRLARAVPVMTPWYESVEELGARITPRTKAIIVNNPHNPTGRRLSADQLRGLHRLADQHGLFLIADEAYHEFVPAGERFVSALEHDPDKRHTIVCNSMSKNYGISGWRIGYLVAGASLLSQIIKIQQHLVTCAPTILSYYLAEHFESVLERTRPQIRRVVETRNRMGRLLADRGVDCLEGDATFYLFASLGGSKLNSDDFAHELLVRHGVGVVPGSGYGASCDRFVRIAVGAESEERLIRGVSAVATLIEETR